MPYVMECFHISLPFYLSPPSALSESNHFRTRILKGFVVAPYDTANC